MREALAFITFILLFWVGWKQSYQDHLADLLGEPAPGAKRVAARQVAATSVASESTETDAPAKDAWMWDRSSLDSPNEMKTHGR
jgi:hypothetical protein